MLLAFSSRSFRQFAAFSSTAGSPEPLHPNVSDVSGSDKARAWDRIQTRRETMHAVVLIRHDPPGFRKAETHAKQGNAVSVSSRRVRQNQGPRGGEREGRPGFVRTK